MESGSTGYISKSLLGDYFGRVWRARYICMHLALSDLRAKFRRSHLGLAWAIINPLMLTLLLALVMGTIFGSPVRDYAPFVFSGIIVWEFVVSSAIMGCTSLINSEGYIKQFNHPLAMYALRYVLVSGINLALGFLGLLVWVLFWNPAHVVWVPFICLIVMPLYLLLVWPLAIITSFVNTRFRDFSQLLVIVFQAIWYVSPVFIEPRIFQAANLEFLVEFNPVFHILNVLRKPMLEGQLPDMINFICLIVLALILWVLAIRMINRQERYMIFHL